MSKICSKLTIKTPERRRRHSNVFIVNFEQMSQIVLVFLLLTLNKYMPAGVVLAISSANIYLFKFTNRNTRKRCKICSELKIKTSKWRHWRRCGVLLVNFDHISHFFSVSIVEFNQVNFSWVFSWNFWWKTFVTFLANEVTWTNCGCNSFLILGVANK